MDSVVSGGVVAMGAFVLATLRSTWEARSERQRRDRSVLSAIAEEIEANRLTATNNRELIRTELKVLEGGERIVNPLDPLETGFWELVKVSPPRDFARDATALASVRRVARLTAQVNEMQRSRERFRVAGPLLQRGNQAGLPEWVAEMRGYDGLIERFLGELLEALDQLEPAIRAWRQHS